MRPILRNIAALALAFGTIGAPIWAETVTLLCPSELEGVSPDELVFDVENRRVKYGGWDWSDPYHWGDQFIMWSHHHLREIDGDGYLSAAVFLYDRSSGFLYLSAVSELMARHHDHYLDGTMPPKRCTRTF